MGRDTGGKIFKVNAPGGAFPQDPVLDFRLCLSVVYPTFGSTDFTQLILKSIRRVKSPR